MADIELRTEANQILCSTGTFLGKANNYDYRLIPYFAEKINCDGFELMIDKPWYKEPDEMIETVKSFNLNIPVIHANKRLGEYLCGMTASFDDEGYKEYIMTDEEEEKLFADGTEKFLMNLKVAEKLGAKKMVLHLWNGIASDKRLENNIRRFGTWKAMAEEAGVDILAENVVCNKNDPLSNMEQVAAAYENVGFTYDTKMSEFHAQTMDLFNPDHEHLLREGRIRHLHMNDYAGGYMDWDNLSGATIGEGHVDFDSFFEKLYSYGYDGNFTIEKTVLAKDGTVDLDELNRNVELLRKMIAKF